ncbi:MAG TPA: DNA mismatch repair endonuclease MutL [Chitinophagaceae bacterium]|nr:DNA mismatch repair endonuclease MutL [Chitinophagaceae bacterium]
MKHEIKLLPDHLANQIAAGEVIQRPASVVKELVENAIDAQATDIQIVIEDAGKRLIQVIDNGVGMNPFNLRMSFERHATSKINKIDDLFSIKTKGFRREALASIAAVAQVEVRSRTEEEATGTSLFIENSIITEEALVAMDTGTNFSVKNLFYNVPARRKFLKSTNVEFRHIAEEFFKIALAHPQLHFRLFHNGKEQYHVTEGTFKNRIVSLLGSRYESNLIPVEEITDLVTIKGFIGGPKAATKSRGNQYFFVNGRYIRSPYLHHAVMKSFEDIIEKDTFPFYVLYLDLNADKVDVNVHPTKQEVKFEDESLLYAYIHAAVKHALARYNITPSLDFHLDEETEQLSGISQPMTSTDATNANRGYLAQTFSQKGQSHMIPSSGERRLWQQQKENFSFPDFPSSKNREENPHFPSFPNQERVEGGTTKSDASFQTDLESSLGYGAHAFSQFMFWDPYIITTVKSGMLLLHSKRALEAILYERLLRVHLSGRLVTQQLLFPVDISIDPKSRSLIEDSLNDFKELGYELHMTEGNNYQLLAVPIDLPSGREQEIIDDIIEQLKLDQDALKDSHREEFLKNYVSTIARFKKMNQKELMALIDDLFACENPQYSPQGKRIFRILSQDELDVILTN